MVHYGFMNENSSKWDKITWWCIKKELSGSLSWGLRKYPQKYALPYSDFWTTYGFLEVILTYWFWSHVKFLNIEHSWAVFQKMALKSVKLIFNSVWIAEYSYILSKNGFEALNFWNFHSGSKPVGQNHFKESIGSPKITVQ